MSERMIPVACILDPEWNSRLWTESAEEKRETEDLATTMERDGQLQAISVELTDVEGQYLLVLGSRRLRAAKTLDWADIRADVQPASDPVTRVARNILENVKRKDLTSYEQARACAKLRDLGLTGPEIGERLGFSKQKVSNLAVSFNALPPNVLDEWRQNHPAATVDFLRELASVGKEEKDPEKRAQAITEAWEDRKELLVEAAEVVDPPPPAEPCPKKVGGKKCALDKGHEGECKPPREPMDVPLKVPYQRYKDLLKAVQKSKVAGGTLAVECVKFLVGHADKVKGIIEPEPEAAE
jgi:ParB/RepB/Spo0J family partition protein